MTGDREDIKAAWAAANGLRGLGRSVQWAQRELRLGKHLPFGVDRQYQGHGEAGRSGIQSFFFVLFCF